MRKTKLIVLRGPSGSGKSTTANALFEKAKNRIALIEQDHYRFIFKPAGGGSKANASAIHKMIKGDVLIALQDGYDVILEGILNVKSYSQVLDDIFAKHTGDTYMYSTGTTPWSLPRGSVGGGEYEGNRRFPSYTIESG